MRFSFFVVALLVFSKVSAQELLANGNFEDENICTEYHVNCAPAAWISTVNSFNNYFKDPKIAHGGSHCMAVEAGHSKFHFERTFIRSQLLCKLRKGHQYRISFFVKSPFNILDSVGVVFTSYDILFVKDVLYQAIPSFYLADGPNHFIKTDSGWQKAVFDYTAKGDEQYITLGNFSKRDITGPTGIPKENYFLIFFDDLSLIPIDPSEKICTDWQQTKDAIYDQHERHEYLNRLIKYYDGATRFPESPQASQTSILVIDTLLLPDVQFKTGKSELQQSSYILLDSFWKHVTDKQIDSLVIEGHADSTGSATLNKKLSMERANSVANYFLSKSEGLASRIITRGWGSTKPIEENNTAEGRKKNRRVEIFLYLRE